MAVTLILISVIAGKNIFWPQPIWNLSSLEATQIYLSGCVIKEEVEYGQQVIEVQIYDIQNEGESAETIPKELINTKVLCYLDSSCDIFIGQNITVMGKIEVFTRATNPGSFDARSFYAARNMFFVLQDAKVIYMGEKYNFLSEGLHRVKIKAGAQLQKFFHEEDAGILKAMLLGEKNEIDRELKNLYKDCGIAHILAISGLHISILGSFLFLFLKRLRVPIYPAVILSILVMILYGNMVSMGASTFRAVIMFSFLLFAKVCKRTYDLQTSLVLSAFILLIFNERVIGDTAFYLSYSAVFGIGFLYPALFADCNPKRKMAVAIHTSFCITLGTLPFVLQSFYEISVLTFLFNLIILPFMSALISLASLVIILGWMHIPFLPAAIAFVCHCILNYYEQACIWFQKIPFGNIIIGSPGKHRIILYFVLLVLFIALSKRIAKQQYVQRKLREKIEAKKKNVRLNKERMKERKDFVFFFIIKMAAVACAVFVLICPRPGGFRMTFLDVGQGDGICIANGKDVYMVDGGSLGKRKVGEYTIVPFLKSQGIGTVSGWFLTHSDKDHISGFMEILQEDNMYGLKIEHVYLSETESEEAKEVIDLAKEKQISIHLLSGGDKIVNNQMEIECLSPIMNHEYLDKNDGCLVLKLTYQNFTTLLMGDAMSEGENSAIKLGCRDITILKVGHHGSKTSTSTEFLETMNPKCSIISVGANNSYGHPNEELMERLAQIRTRVYRTDEGGAIIIRTDGEKVWVKEYAK